MYWSHVHMFPHPSHITQEHLNELFAYIVHANLDAVTSLTSTSTYWTKPDMQQMLNTVQMLREAGDYTSAPIVSMVGRLMGEFSLHKFVNFFGQPFARLDRDHNVVGEKHKHSKAVKILSPLLLYAPETHFKGLRDIFADEILALGPWTDFMQKIRSEWQEFVLYSTVLLNANVAFLAINNLPHAPQIASYVSTAASVGSIVTGLLLNREHRSLDEVVTNGIAYLGKHTTGTMGLGALAVRYSLPYALLMWSMAAFLVALCLNCFWTDSLPYRIITGVAWLIVTIFMIWCIVAALDQQAIKARWAARFASIKGVIFRERKEASEEKEETS